MAKKLYEAQVTFINDKSLRQYRTVEGNTKEELVAAAQKVKIKTPGYRLSVVRLVSFGGRKLELWSINSDGVSSYSRYADDSIARLNEHRESLKNSKRAGSRR